MMARAFLAGWSRHMGNETVLAVYAAMAHAGAAVGGLADDVDASLRQTASCPASAMAPASLGRRATVIDLTAP